MTGTILREIESHGYQVSVEDSPGITRMFAVDSRTGETFVAETDLGQFETACELARIVGIELEDG